MVAFNFLTPEKQEESLAIKYQRKLKAATSTVIAYVLKQDYRNQEEKFLGEAVLKAFITEFEDLGAHRWEIDLEKDQLIVFEEEVEGFEPLPRGNFFSPEIPLIRDFTEQCIEFSEGECAWLLLYSYTFILEAIGLKDHLHIDAIIREILLKYTEVKKPNQFGIICRSDENDPTKLELRFFA